MHGVLQRVVEAARVAVPGADLVSVTLRADNRFHTPVQTDELATRLDEVAVPARRGPVRRVHPHPRAGPDLLR